MARIKTIIILLFIFVENSFSQQNNVDTDKISPWIGGYTSISKENIYIYVYVTKDFNISHSKKRKKMTSTWNTQITDIVNLPSIIDSFSRGYPYAIPTLAIIVTESEFIVNEIIPKCKNNEELTKKLIYSYSYDRDTLLNKEIELLNKVSIDSTVFYYPIKSVGERFCIFRVKDVAWFLSVFPKNKWYPTLERNIDLFKTNLLLYVPFIDSTKGTHTQ
ncbi:MAG: hypothetical protein LBR36_02125 [Bacteroidales bacterium]|jgi:hypothetical protein|nr:hypothetical protein [Bacteroidales bacterium]